MSYRQARDGKTLHGALLPFGVVPVFVVAVVERVAAGVVNISGDCGFGGIDAIIRRVIGRPVRINSVSAEGLRGAIAVGVITPGHRLVRKGRRRARSRRRRRQPVHRVVTEEPVAHYRIRMRQDIAVRRVSARRNRIRINRTITRVRRRAAG